MGFIGILNSFGVIFNGFVLLLMNTPDMQLSSFEASILFLANETVIIFDKLAVFQALVLMSIPVKNQFQIRILEILKSVKNFVKMKFTYCLRC